MFKQTLILTPFMAMVFGLLAGNFQYAVQAKEPGRAYAKEISITPLLQTSRTNIGQPIRYPDAGQPEVMIVRVEVPPGVNTGWHQHPVHTYAVLLRGELTIRQQDGENRVYRAGDAFAEMVDTVHRGENHGDEPVELLMFVTGEQSVPVTIPAEDQ